MLDRSQPYAPKTPHCFIKDNKPYFVSCSSITLFCPTKSDLGKTTKDFIDKIVPIVRNKVKLPLWAYTGDIIWWLENFNDKSKYSFIQFDIANYYGSISPNLLSKALIFSRNVVDISKLDIDIILSAKKILIEHEEHYWQRADTASLFDITMVSRLSPGY